MVHAKVGLHLGVFTYQHFYDAGLLISYYAFIILHWKFGQTSLLDLGLPCPAVMGISGHSSSEVIYCC